MFKKLALVTCITVITAFASGCSDSGGGDSSGTTGGTTGTTGGTTGTTGGTTGTTGGTTGTTGGTTGTTGGTTGTTGGTTGTTGGTTGSTGGGTGGTPTGTIEGVWFGTSNFGDAVLVVDGNGSVNGLSVNAGSYQSVFNTDNGVETFIHRDSDDPGFATSFTIAGDRGPAANYGLSVANDGQQLNVADGAGDFSLTFATTNDVAAIDVASVAGTWEGRTAFAPADSRLLLQVTIGADGTLGGFTQFNDTAQIALNGTVAAAPNSTQYLVANFIWNGDQGRTGVIYRDRNQGGRLVLNTVGEDPGVDVDGQATSFSTFSGYLLQP